MLADNQHVWISSRVTAFTVVCEACAQLSRGEGYGGAAVTGWLPIDARHGVLECPRGHRLLIERDD